MRLALAIAVFWVSAACAGADLADQIAVARAAGDQHAEIELLRRWTDSHPGDQSALQRLAVLWLSVADFELAQETLEDVTEPGFLARAKAEILLTRDKDLSGAIAVLESRLLAAAKDRPSRLMLAEYLGRAGRYDEEIAAIDLLMAEESSLDLLLDRAEARLKSGDAVGALADYRKALTVGEESERLQRESASYERLAMALAELEKVPQSPFLRAYWWLYAGLSDKALVETREGLARWPHSALGQILDARCLVATGAMDASKARLERKVEVSTSLEAPDVVTGLLQADQALAANLENLKARLARAVWLMQAGQNLLALADVQQALSSAPDAVEPLQAAVTVYCRLGNLTSASACANLLLERKAGASARATAFREVGELAFLQSNVALALDFAGRSLAAQPTNSGWKLKAACHERMGQREQAVQATAKAAKEKR